MSLSEIQRFLNGFDSLYNAKEYKTQTLKDTEINLKKTVLHGLYKIYTSQKIKGKKNRIKN